MSERAVTSNNIQLLMTVNTNVIDVNILCVYIYLDITHDVYRFAR
jgi:hypothetical protein